MVSVNNSTSGAEAHLPVRRQRSLRQREPSVRHLGARPVHPLAGDELGLLRAPPEGPDGHRRARGRSRRSGCRPTRARATGDGDARALRRFRPASEVVRLLHECLRLLLLGLVRGEVAGARALPRPRRSAGRPVPAGARPAASTVPPPPSGGGGSSPVDGRRSPLRSPRAATRRASPSMPLTTSTSLSSGTADSCAART